MSTVVSHSHAGYHPYSMEFNSRGGKPRDYTRQSKVRSLSIASLNFVYGTRAPHSVSASFDQLGLYSDSILDTGEIPMQKNRPSVAKATYVATF